MSDNIYLVYKHTSPSGKSYIGVTNDYPKRCREHQYRTQHSRLFYKAIKKYGWDNFLHEILYDNLTLVQANWREQQSINEYGSLAPSGYNLHPGGECKTHHPETKELIRKASIGRAVGLKYWNDGVVTIRCKEHPGEGWVQGRLLSDKTKQKLAEKIRAKTVGKQWWNNGVSQVLVMKKPTGVGWVSGMLPSHRDKLSTITAGRHRGSKWWCDGETERRSAVCPGEGWHTGKL